MSEWIKIPDWDDMIGTECIGCGKLISLGRDHSALVPRLCDECKEAIGFAKELMKEQEEKPKTVIDEHGITIQLPDVVKCKFCKYWKDETERNKQPSWLPCMAVKTRADFYCADGDKA